MGVFARRIAERGRSPVQIVDENHTSAALSPTTLNAVTGR
jgi:hypothetical protein